MDKLSLIQLSDEQEQDNMKEINDIMYKSSNQFKQLKSLELSMAKGPHSLSKVLSHLNL